MRRVGCCCALPGAAVAAAVDADLVLLLLPEPEAVGAECLVESCAAMLIVTAVKGLNGAGTRSKYVVKKRLSK